MGAGLKDVAVGEVQDGRGGVWPSGEVERFSGGGKGSEAGQLFGNAFGHQFLELERGHAAHVA